MKEKLPLGKRPEVRIVGKAPEEAKEEARKLLSALFGEYHLADMTEEMLQEIKEKELQKDRIDRDIIKAANEMINELLQQWGLQPFDIPDNNIHIIPDSLYGKIFTRMKIGDEMGATRLSQQAIFINGEFKNKDFLDYLTGLFHEICHLKGYYAEELIKNNSDSYARKGYRIGFISAFPVEKLKRIGKNPKRTIVNFLGLNEAVVSDVVNVYTKEVLLKVGNEEALKSIEQLNHEGLLEGKSYLDQLEVLEFVIKSIAEKTNLDEKVVRTLFHKAHFSGNILEIGRLVEETFGKGSFRFLGTMDSGGKSALRVLDHLQKQKRLLEKKE